MEKISIGVAEHYQWGNGCDGWHLVRQPELAVIAERMPPGTAEVPHRHRRARQFFYVLAGQAVLELAGRRVDLMAGEGLEVPPGTPHAIANPGPAELQFLVIAQPHHHGDREPAGMVDGHPG